MVNFSHTLTLKNAAYDRHQDAFALILWTTEDVDHLFRQIGSADFDPDPNHSIIYQHGNDTHTGQEVWAAAHNNVPKSVSRTEQGGTSALKVSFKTRAQPMSQVAGNIILLQVFYIIIYTYIYIFRSNNAEKDAWGG